MKRIDYTNFDVADWLSSQRAQTMTYDYGDLEFILLGPNVKDAEPWFTDKYSGAAKDFFVCYGYEFADDVGYLLVKQGENEFAEIRYKNAFLVFLVPTIVSLLILAMEKAFDGFDTLLNYLVETLPEAEDQTRELASVIKEYANATQ